MLDHLPRRHTQPFFDDLDAALGGASHRDEANPADEVAAWLDCAVVDTVGDTDGELDGELDGQAPRVIDAPLSASKNQGTAPPVIEPMTEVPATSTPPRKDDIATMMEALTASVQNSASDVSGLSKPQIQGLLQGYEHLHSAILMYMWLSFRFPATFVDALSAELIKERVEQAIVALLSIQTPRKKKVLPLRSTPSNHAAFRSYRS
ncbi:hypothetical protein CAUPRSCDRAFT_12746 [Caulochytrium protostelioides]|uniref:ATP-dependent RNA helicase SUV3 C-terminal domain-containing protein n=1 Tax=Caulochytrium protostelioides TaxID=1555241 RepID=A0A4V1IT23_9FUNG|nr:hypothetical protein CAUPRSCDRAFT_12746 [Caulochytrium protostelioides]